ncbi:MAG: SDR family oxidoreductase, partial [Sandarakinorhabdus sp.]|nr:SDR family oxidoreductase [Sandarakinorhabdus sp.]
MSTATHTAAGGRLAGKVALITGAAGNLGQAIARRYLDEGATVVFSGRDRARTDAARDAAIAAADVAADRAFTVVIDGADAESVRAGIAEVVARYGRVDVLVNNAGSAGPKQPLENLPLSRDDLAALQAGGSSDGETVGDAARNIMVVAWNMVRAAAGAMGDGGSIINVSTIFSRTEYYARAAYTVPKAAMNAMSREMAAELGPRGIRVNLLFPGPIASERIRSVFATMDGLRGDEPGATAKHFFDLMALERSVEGAPKAKTFPTPADIANTCVFLGSDESAAFAGHDFEVTHGMRVAGESRSTFASRPAMRPVDGDGLGVLVAAGSQTEDAMALARVQADCGARVLLGFHSKAAADEVAEKLGSDHRIIVANFDRHDHVAMDQALADFTARHFPITGALVLPTRPAGYFSGALGEASDAQVERFVDDEL